MKKTSEVQIIFLKKISFPNNNMKSTNDIFLKTITVDLHIICCSVLHSSECQSHFWPLLITFLVNAVGHSPMSMRCTHTHTLHTHAQHVFSGNRSDSVWVFSRTSECNPKSAAGVGSLIDVAVRSSTRNNDPHAPSHTKRHSQSEHIQRPLQWRSLLSLSLPHVGARNCFFMGFFRRRHPASQQRHRIAYRPDVPFEAHTHLLLHFRIHVLIPN